MEWLFVVYLIYMFFSLYFLAMYLILYFKSKNEIFSSPTSNEIFSVSILIPAYNEEETVTGTVESVFKSDYANILEVIVINDGSKDKTVSIVRELMKKYPKLKLLDKKNSGKADSLNQGFEIAQGELVAVVDSDSFPDSDAIRKLVGFFENEKVGAATVPILVRNKNKFFEKLQAVEYTVIALTRKLLEKIDAIYVTPGPLALYRKKAVLEVGGFDPRNLTEDIELTWRLAAHGWQRKMCLDTKVTTLVPNKFRKWWKQRERWSMGGIQTIFKYRNYFLRKGIVGYFILPFFIISTMLGLLGLIIFGYLFFTKLIRQFFFIKFSYTAATPIIDFSSFYFTPSVLNYFGIVLFFLGTIFTFFVLGLMKEEVFRKRNIFNILFYLMVYLMIYPFILIGSVFKLIKGDMSW